MANADRASGSGRFDCARGEARLGAPHQAGADLQPRRSGGDRSRLLRKCLVVFPMVLRHLRLNDPLRGETGGEPAGGSPRQGMSQEQVAERSGVHATEVSRIEAGNGIRA